MKITEAIKELNEILNRYGDLELEGNVTVDEMNFSGLALENISREEGYAVLSIRDTYNIYGDNEEVF